MWQSMSIYNCDPIIQIEPDSKLLSWINPEPGPSIKPFPPKIAPESVILQVTIFLKQRNNMLVAKLE